MDISFPGDINFGVDPVTFSIEVWVEPCGATIKAGAGVSIDLPFDGAVPALLVTAINAGIAAAQEAMAAGGFPGTLAFDSDTNTISLTEEVSYDPGLPSEVENILPVPIFEELIELDLGLATISVTIKLTMEFKLKVTNAPPYLVGVGKLTLESNVDFCVELSGDVEGKKCGADIPTCDPFPTASVMSPTFEAMVCWMFGSECVPGSAGTGSGSIDCQETQNVNLMFGEPPFEIVPYDGTRIELDFGQFCSEDAAVSVADGTCAAMVTVRGAFELATNIGSIGADLTNDIATTVAIGASVARENVVLALTAGSTNTQYDINVADQESATAISGNLDNGPRLPRLERYLPRPPPRSTVFHPSHS